MAAVKILHFGTAEETATQDRLRKLCPVLDYYMLKAFESAYSPEESFAVDESLVKCRGCLPYAQFNPSKWARFGIKFYKLCGSSSRYCLRFSIYKGQDTKSSAISSMLSDEAVVTDLLGDRIADRHTIYTDNWYTSSNLFLAFRSAGSNAVGTVRKNR